MHQAPHWTARESEAHPLTAGIQPKAQEYVEHRKLHAHGLVVSDATLPDGDRLVYVSADGNWLTPAEFRALAAAMQQFAKGLPE